MAPSDATPLKRGLPPMHPGEMLREITLPALKEEGIGKGDFAARLGVSRVMLDKLVKEASAVTPEMALRLARVLDTTPEFWMNLQTAWDLAKVREAAAAELAAIRPIPRPRAA